jgi:hypothetical protein
MANDELCPQCQFPFSYRHKQGCTYRQDMKRAKDMVIQAAFTFFIEREKGEVCDCLTPHYGKLQDALGALEQVKAGRDVFDDEE